VNILNPIDPSFYLKNESTERTPSPELGKEDFLKILMVQLQNQDPLSPMEDTEFISQMANFSSLEQMMNISKSIDTLVQSQLVSPVIQYSHMVGQTVSYQTYDEETGAELGIEKGEVVAVSQQDGWAILHIDNGEKMYADAVVKVSS